MEDVFSQFLEVLKLEKIDECLYRGSNLKTHHPRVFGGQVFAQAMRAAQDTVKKNRFIHSQHAYFLRPGDSALPIVYTVDEIRDGTSFTTRRVIASQRGKAIFNTSMSFQIREQGLHHQHKMPDCAGPDELEDDQVSWLRAANSLVVDKKITFKPRPIELRSVEPLDYLNPKKRSPRQHIWLRTRGKLDESANQNHGIHEAILSYASDFNLMSTALLPHKKSIFDQNLQPASLDHAIWFHDEFRVDNWLLYSLDSPYSGNSRGFNRGTFFTQEGKLVASAVQEGLMRIHPKN